MYRLITLSFCLFLSSFANAQEFVMHNNGLIYPDTTVRQLKYIVDSLNLKHKHCDPYKEYRAIRQARGYYIEVDTIGDIKSIIRDMGNGMKYEDFIRRYYFLEPQELLVLKTKVKGYKDSTRVLFSGLVMNAYFNIDLYMRDTTLYDKDQAGEWVYDYRAADNYSGKRLLAFYFPNGFQNQVLPFEYAKMVQYADCMIDTNSSIYFKSAKSDNSFLGGEAQIEKPNQAADTFFAYVNKATNKPVCTMKYEEPGYKECWNAEFVWDTARFTIINNKLVKTHKFKKLFGTAVSETILKEKANWRLEEYVERYGTPSQLLALKRARIVVGTCSEDDGPRLHALDIAKLSAASVNWEIFLRAHLDIMNDHFSRVTDGSYAQDERQTYIKELEVLDIDVTTLLLGIMLKIENPSGTHYFGSVQRIGRAIAESEHADIFERQMIAMVADTHLDDLNRVMAYYLCKNYLNYVENEDSKKKSKLLLRNAVIQLPYYIRKHFSI